VKSDIEAKVTETRSAAQSEDVEKIKSATEALGLAIQKIGAAVYEQGQAAGEGEAGQQSDSSSGQSDAGPDVVEGEVKE
jgi:molecular chaperone DnaK